MSRNIISFLKKYSSNEHKANSLIVTAFVLENGLHVKRNRLIKSYLINEQSKYFKHLSLFRNLLRINLITFDFEFLIQLFEFVISPKDKKVNGAVYTPEYIRNLIIDEALIPFDDTRLESAKIGDLSMGCGGFLFSVAKVLMNRLNKTYSQIFRDNLYGLDLTNYSIERTKILLSLLAISASEDEGVFDFNFVEGNALEYSWKVRNRVVKNNGGFDIILGNPPYVCSRNVNRNTLKLFRNWEVCSTGHPDLYIPFFQIGMESLARNGVLGFITVNTFLKSLNGRALRRYLSKQKKNLKIVNFGGEQVFKGRNTYTCLCFIVNAPGEIQYQLVESKSIASVNEIQFNQFNFDDLNNNDGWNLVNSLGLSTFVKTVEDTGVKFKDIFVSRSGLATLRNDIFIFKPIKTIGRYYAFFSENGEVMIEKEICREVINANKIKSEADILLNDAKIIFPFETSGNKIKLISESRFRLAFPMAYSYLRLHREILEKRDKGKAKRYEAWFDYGRRQSLDINKFKLFFPHISQSPSFVISTKKDLLFYNGLAVISDDLTQLQFLKKIFESTVFLKYVQITAKNYASNFVSFSLNYIKNFGIPILSEEQKQQIINSEDSDSLITELYGVSFEDFVSVDIESTVDEAA